jgi:C4-dicarboxylate-specific signal transduction histidine kinase
MPRRILVDLNGLVRESVGLLGRDLTRLRVTLVLSLSEADPTVYAERLQLQQVIVNLVSNAAEAMAVGDRSDRQLSISTQRRNRESVVVITDTGPGIDASVRDHLFRPFTTTKPDGMGLGLSICESIITRQGGRIFADSGSERGASFVFVLPASE